MCPSFVLLTPTVMNYYRRIDKELGDISNKYSKEKVFDFILGNLKFHRI